MPAGAATAADGVMCCRGIHRVEACDRRDYLSGSGRRNSTHRRNDAMSWCGWSRTDYRAGFEVIRKRFGGSHVLSTTLRVVLFPRKRGDHRCGRPRPGSSREAGRGARWSKAVEGAILPPPREVGALARRCRQLLTAPPRHHRRALRCPRFCNCATSRCRRREAGRSAASPYGDRRQLHRCLLPHRFFRPFGSRRARYRAWRRRGVIEALGPGVERPRRRRPASPTPGRR